MDGDTSIVPSAGSISRLEVWGVGYNPFEGYGTSETATPTPTHTATDTATNTPTSTPTNTPTDVPSPVCMAPMMAMSALQQTPANGLNAEFFNDTPQGVFQNCAATLIVDNIDFQWMTDEVSDPDATDPLPDGVSSQYFSAIFTGWIQLPTPGTYEFELTADDGARVLINNQVVINDFFHPTSDGPDPVIGTFASSGINVNYPIRIEYYQIQFATRLQLRWRLYNPADPNPWYVVPSEILFPQEPMSPTPVPTSTSVPTVESPETVVPTTIPTVIFGTPAPNPVTWYVGCSPFGDVAVREYPNRFATQINLIPSGTQIQTINQFIDGGMTAAYGSGNAWVYIVSPALYNGYIWDGTLTTTQPGPCPPAQTRTPTPVPPATPTPSSADLDLIGRVIACEAAGTSDGIVGITHTIMNRVESNDFPSTPIEVVTSGGVDCYDNQRYLEPQWDLNSTTWATYGQSQPLAAAQALYNQAPMPMNHQSILALDLSSYYWLGLELGVNVVIEESEPFRNYIANTIVDNPQLYNYTICSPNDENRAIRIQRILDRLVAFDWVINDGRLFTVYFSRSPLCNN